MGAIPGGVLSEAWCVTVIRVASSPTMLAAPTPALVDWRFLLFFLPLGKLLRTQRPLYLIDALGEFDIMTPETDGMQQHLSLAHRHLESKSSV